MKAKLLITFLLLAAFGTSCGSSSPCYDQGRKRRVVEAQPVVQPIQAAAIEVCG
jgi:hypothetical protein